MKVLKSWLNDYVRIELSNNDLADRLTMTGTAIDSISGTIDSNIIVARIIEIKKHPNADRLRLAKVDTGKETLEIVCGAPNIEVGQHVPLALIGAKIGEIKIEKANIRGIESNGMLCSERELGLGDDHSGIKILSNETKIGALLSDYIESDAVFDIEVTPNRGDELSHYGVAREIAAITKQQLKQNRGITLESNAKKSKLSVIVENKENCLQYKAIKINGVEIKESPEWLKNRLIKCGLRPINNVVDITNYVMLDLGQPLHAFDANKITDEEIIVRLAGDGEIIITLDGRKIDLVPTDLLITDKEKPLAIAGIIGGLDSEVTQKTTDIILESAEFNRKSIRKTAKRLFTSTEASYRFERGIDSGCVGFALEKAARMIEEFAGGKIASHIISAGKPEENRTTKIEHDNINKLLGLNLSNIEIDKILQSIGFEISNDTCVIPSWRHDVSIWQDLAEEIGRIYGFDKIPKNIVGETAIPSKSNYHKKEYLKDALVNSGFVEVYTYPFLSESDLAVVKIEPTDLLEVSNPMNVENKYMRKSLLPGLLKATAKNPTFDPIAIFEIGNVFTKEAEVTNIGLCVSGKNARKIIDSAIEAIINISAVDKETLLVKELPREELARYKIRKPLTYVLEIPVERIIHSMNISEGELALRIEKGQSHYRPISKFPSITRDVAFIVDKTIDAEEISNTMYDISGLINRVELFDEFASEKFGAGKKNVAYHLDLQHLDRTLTDKEAEKVIDEVVSAVKDRFGGEVR